MRYSVMTVAGLVAAMFVLSAHAQDVGQPDDVAVGSLFKETGYSPYAGRHFPTRPYFGDTEETALQRNSRVGITAVVPLKGPHAIRASWSSGFVTHSGGDYDTFSINYLYAW